MRYSVLRLWLFSAAMMLLVVSVGLWYDYRVVKDTSEELTVLQEEYRNYILTLKGMIDVLSRNNPDQEEASETARPDEKKKSFVVVDRRPDYLRQSLINYIREKDLNIDVDEVDRIYKSYSGSPKVRKSHRKYRLPKIRHKKILHAKIGLARLLHREVPEIQPVEQEIPHEITFAWPVDRNQCWISSYFGRRKLKGVWGFHKGLDLATMKGTPVRSIAVGKVIEAGPARGFGNTVLVQHGANYRSRYAHMQRIKVHVGQAVSVGQCIGTVGDTGYVTSSGHDASHLHLEIYRKGKNINPLCMLT